MASNHLKHLRTLSGTWSSGMIFASHRRGRAPCERSPVQSRVYPSSFASPGLLILFAMCCFGFLAMRKSSEMGTARGHGGGGRTENGYRCQVVNGFHIHTHHAIPSSKCIMLPGQKYRSRTPHAHLALTKRQRWLSGLKPDRCMAHPSRSIDAPHLLPSIVLFRCPTPRLVPNQPFRLRAVPSWAIPTRTWASAGAAKHTTDSQPG